MTPAALSSAERADLFRALARLQDAGLPADRAVVAMRDLLGAGHARRLKTMSELVAAGATLSEAGNRAGLLSRRDFGLMRLAERGGAQVAAASMLADAYAFRARLNSRLKSHMMLPLCVLLLALFLMPLPALAGGQIGAAEYVLRAFAPAILLLVVAAVCRGLGRRTAATGVSAPSGRLLLMLPVVGPAVRLAGRLELLEGLRLLLAAGVPAREALGEALRCLSNPAARTDFGPAQTRLEAQGVSAALNGAGALEGDEFAIVSTSEQAGRLEEGLERVAGGIRDRLRSRLELLSEWLPRGVYLLVVGVIAAGLLGG